MVDGKLYSALALLETRVHELERKVDELRKHAGACESCMGLKAERCLRCERDLCAPCLQLKTCAHARDGGHV
jgi:hypothetical protein